MKSLARSFHLDSEYSPCKRLAAKPGTTFENYRNDILYKVPFESREGMQVGLQLALLPRAPHAMPEISGHTAWLPKADGCGKVRYTVVAGVETRGCSVFPVCQYLEWGNQFTWPHIDFPHHWAVFHTPRQTLLRIPSAQAFLNFVTLHKYIQVHQFLNTLLPGQSPCAFPIATSQEVINQQSIQPHS